MSHAIRYAFELISNLTLILCVKLSSDQSKLSIVFNIPAESEPSHCVLVIVDKPEVPNTLTKK